MKRPLLLVALLYASGIIVAACSSVAPLTLLGSSLFLGLIALVWSSARPLLLWLLIPLTGWTNAAVSTAIFAPHDVRRLLGDAPQLVTCRGILHETPAHKVFIHEEKEAWRTLARLDVTGLRFDRQLWQPASGRIAIATAGMLTNFFAGQTVEIAGVGHQPRLAVAEGTFDYRFYLKQQGIHYQVDATEKDWQLLASPPQPPLADRFRNWARQALALGLPVEDESLRLEWALTLGWKPALTEEVSEAFVQAATYHIFAVDGLRMMIIFGIFFGLLRVMNVPRSACGLLLIPLIWFYTALTGWPASAIRASVMLTLVMFGWVIKRPTDLLNSLFAAALIILICDPQQLFQAGFQLSFCVVLCMVVTMPVLQDLWNRLWAPDPLLPASLHSQWRRVLAQPGKRVSDVLLTSFAAWIGSIPLVAHYFHIVTPVSTPANLLAVPLCALVLISNFGSLLLVAWFPAGAILLNHAGWFLMECIRTSSHWFAGWPKAFFYVPAPHLFSSALYYALLLGLFTGWLFKPKFRAWRITAVTLAASVWCVLWLQEGSQIRLHILPVNGGIAQYFDAPGTKNDLLVDCGASNSVAAIIKPFLRAQGVNSLPNLALTHGDVRHVGGGKMCVDLFAVNHVWISPVRFRSAPYRRLLDDFGRSSGKLRSVSRSDRLGAWTVLHPEIDDHFPQADDNALVLLGVFDGPRVLLVSDLGRAGQNALLERVGDLKADIVVTGLPARSEALGDTFLDSVQPRVIIVADSEYPSSERAGLQLCERLAQRKTPVIYTRSAGAATIEFHKGNWRIRTMNGLTINSDTLLLQTNRVSQM